ncbi:uncharacterized protein LOC130429813 [Triplophysa dalaica]|uniref:uncharacterized protein LOC130429813 n=1 Tax=Triplophysa dalaica TaxID=1582913 RepID=UPI0024E013FE|nr:uncharacterized protein LOC130429813 [Triplophysa dalaica]
MDRLIDLIVLSGLVCIPGSLSVNLAFKGTATQSSTYSTWEAQRAIDGKRYESVYCSSTGSQSNSWWRLDLLNIYNIGRVIITAHGSYLHEVSGAEIRIGDSLENNGNNNSKCAVISDPLPGNTISYSCYGMKGRYVNVIMSGRTSRLTLCEVEVYETENLAFKGTIMQSSTLLYWLPERAKDGVRYGSIPSTYCFATEHQSNPWWRLDLMDIYEISTVVITARPDCCEDQTNGAEIRIGNSLENNGNNNPRCAVTSGLLVGHTITYSCGKMKGRYVNVVMSGRTIHLVLCEVEVFGKRNF